jgi:sepiapterin reductase
MESMLVVVTGASKGLGAAIANTFCIEAPKKSLVKVDRIRVILVARSSDLLENISRGILQQHQRENPEIDVKLSQHGVDLSDLDRLDAHIDEIFSDVDLSSFDRVVFVNNAGSIGFLGPCHESPSLLEMKKAVDLNVTSALWMSCRFAKLIQGANAKDKATLVNISSLLALEAFPTMGIYAAGKAARDHYHATMAKELSSETLKILSYAPGPLETEMVNEIRAAPKLDEGLKPAFNKKLIAPSDTAWKLARLVLSGDYESGAHVDYYDLPE